MEFSMELTIIILYIIDRVQFCPMPSDLILSKTIKKKEK